MVSNKLTGRPVPFAGATRVERLDTHTYKVNLDDSFCIGTVPNGGYTSACMLAAATAHLGPRDQPDALTAHFEYPNRTCTGPAIVTIEDVKLGQQVSTLHLTLWQGGLLPQAPWVDRTASRRVVLAYTNHTNLRTFMGISLPTGYEATVADTIPAPPDFEALKTKGADDAWKEARLPPSSATFVRSLQNWRFYLPHDEALAPGVLDMWIRMASGENIQQGALAYVADSFPYNLHVFLAAPELRELLEGPQHPPPSASSAASTDDAQPEKTPSEERASMWFPTVLMNLETKAPLPEEGAEWLAVRVTSKQIKDGRFDLDVTIRDADGDLVALSHHVAMILSVERNTARRSQMKSSL